MKNSYLIMIVVAIAAVLTWAFFFRPSNVEPGKYDELAQCLSDKGAVMYGAYWCSHCANQKKLFGSSWEYVKYTECAIRGAQGQANVCDDAEIQGYPTWIFADGSRQTGEVSLKDLAEKTDCPLPL